MQYHDVVAVALHHPVCSLLTTHSYKLMYTPSNNSIACFRSVLCVLLCAHIRDVPHGAGVAVTSAPQPPQERAGSPKRRPSQRYAALASHLLKYFVCVCSSCLTLAQILCLCIITHHVSMWHVLECVLRYSNTCDLGGIQILAI